MSLYISTTGLSVFLNSLLFGSLGLTYVCPFLYFCIRELMLAVLETSLLWCILRTSVSGVV